MIDFQSRGIKSKIEMLKSRLSELNNKINPPAPKPTYIHVTEEECKQLKVKYVAIQDDKFKGISTMRWEEIDARMNEIDCLLSVGRITPKTHNPYYGDSLNLL